jgi:flagellar basal-body rod protein FlgF
MQSGLYVTLSGQVALERRLATIATNIASQSVVGFRAEEVNFKTILSQADQHPIAFAAQGDTYISRAQGETTKTENPLDIAVQGEGWLALRTPSGIVYTRDGRLRMQASGELQSLAGFPVLDAGNAPIQLDPDAGPPTIAKDGMITQAGQQIGAIGLFSLDAQSKLTRYDNSSVTTDRRANPVLDFTNNGIAQGYVEGANVNPVLELTKLIALTRSFESVSSALEGSENSLKDAIKTLGATS